ncbi:MAG: hypothetical protein EBZ77_17800, partial [Chitinophagia bacterium]|nr:hypothetical protein [Chitinophagia bacterium]
LDFDMHIEFDDEGRPMMGRSVMVDEDAIRKEALEDMLSGPATEAEDARDWGSEDANLIYRLLFAMANKIGISPDVRDYERMIEQISGYVATLYTRSVYAQITKAQGKAALDYDVYRIRFLIAGTAAHLLLNIQTHIPEYIIRYTHEECKAGFFGFPLESEANTSGIECMSGMLAGFMKDDAPWNQTGFQKEGNPVKRKSLFRRYVESLVKDFAKHPLTQNALREKRAYLTKLYGGTGGDLQDQIPTSFRPVPLLLSAEEAAELSVAPASAKEEDAVGTAWIRQAHAIARANTVLNPDIPYAETTCCFHDLRNPQEFWDSNSPFTLAAKRISTKPKSSVFGLSSKVVKQPV